MKIIDRIFLLLEEKGVKAIELARFLEINSSVVATWKARSTNPPSEYISRICDFLSVSPEYLLTGSDDRICEYDFPSSVNTPEEISKVSSSLPSLTPENIFTVRKYVDFLISTQDQQPTVKESFAAYRTISFPEAAPGHDSDQKEDTPSRRTVALLGNSAAGEPLDLPDDPYSFTDLVTLPDGIDADFALRLKGDSMEPNYPDDSIVYVQKTFDVHIGDIVIASIDNQATCKKLQKDPADPSIIILQSLNPKYHPIIVDPDIRSFQIIGKVCKTSKY